MGTDDKKLAKFIEITDQHSFNSIDDLFDWFDRDNTNVRDSDPNPYIVVMDGMWSYYPPLKVLYAVGMPQELYVVEVFVSGRHYNGKYKDYIIDYVGILADDENPDRGRTQGALRFVLPDGESSITVKMHFWSIRLIARNVKAQFVKVWNSGYTRGKGPTLLM